MRNLLLSVLLLGAAACSTQPRVVLSWDPVTTDRAGSPIAPVRYEVFVRVNDGPEQRFGPLSEPQFELPLRIAQCDVVRVQVVSIHRGLRSPRSAVLEQRIVAPPAERPGCSPQQAADCADPPRAV